jgi:hypothetical protein
MRNSRLLSLFHSQAARPEVGWFEIGLAGYCWFARRLVSVRNFGFLTDLSSPQTCLEYISRRSRRRLAASGPSPVLVPAMHQRECSISLAKVREEHAVEWVTRASETQPGWESQFGTVADGTNGCLQGPDRAGSGHREGCHAYPGRRTRCLRTGRIPRGGCHGLANSVLRRATPPPIHSGPVAGSGRRTPANGTRNTTHPGSSCQRASRVKY